MLEEVEELLKKQLLYKEIDTLLHNLSSIHVSHKRNLQVPDLCIAFERDKAISSLRFLYMFYDLPPEVFFLSTTLFDSLLESNQVSPVMFDILHLSCFYVSAISYGHLIQFEDVIKFSSCTGNINLMYSTTNFILAKMQSLETFPTVLSLLKLFLAVLLPRSTVFLDVVHRAVLKLELLVLCHKFNFFRVDELALALCHHLSKQMHLFNDCSSVDKGILELLKHYQMDERRYCLCLREIESHLEAYETQKSINPRLKLSWTISKKLLMKMKPSTRFTSKLEPVMECSDVSSCYSVEDEEMAADKDWCKCITKSDANSCENLKTENSGTTFQFGLETIRQKNTSVIQKLLLTGKVFTICMRDLISTDGNKSITDGKCQPAHILLLPVSKHSTNQLLGLQITKKSIKKRKDLQNIDLLYLVVALGNRSKYFVIPVENPGRSLNLVKF